LLKRLTLVFLLPLYGLATLGNLAPYYALFHRASFQLRVRQGNYQNGTTLNLTEQEYNLLDWTEKGREFKMDGEMYDVSSIKKTNTGYTIICKHDEVDSWLSKIIPSSKQTQKQKAPSKKRRIARSIDKYFPAEFSFTRAALQVALPISPFEKNLSIPLIYSEVESPPPETHHFFI
tara:strand:- start:351163 stop:351690 length:528 start_codon:yes stop_codon:yes gene_type:complete